MNWKLSILLIFVGSAALVWHIAGAWGSGQDSRVLLSDVKSLTLYNGRMTTARRSSPVPQLKCVGGSAGCHNFVPQVVQCYNRGTDGVDVQWECKTDMDNEYRFGQIEVSCEGYDYPEDPYVLQGSCGLEYTIDLTKEGYQKQNRRNEHAEHQYSQHHNSPQYSSKKSHNWFGDLVLIVIIGVVVFALYKTCIAPSTPDSTPDGSEDSTGRGPSGPRGSPPPYGFRDDHMPGTGGGGCSSSMGGSTHTSGHTPTGNTGGGFWSGAATGGFLGYLFGSRTNTGYQHRPTPGYGTGWGSGWGSGTGSWGSGHSSRPTTSSWGSSGSSWGSSSSGTRSASGFGGTKRR